MVQQISGDLAIVHSIVPVGSDPHSYDPKAGDIQLLKQADIIFMNGLHLESWLTRMIKNSQTSARTVTVSKGIIPFIDNNSKILDPHAWMAVLNARIYIRNIVDALVAELPDQKNIFIERYLEYNTSLENLDVYIKGLLNQIPVNKRFLVTSHDAFRYFGEAYQVEVVPLMGTSTEAEPRTSDFIRLSKVIRQFNIPAIFVESTINPVILKQLARDLGIRIGGSLFTDSLGPEGSGAETYIKMMRYNTFLLYTGLSSPGIIMDQALKPKVLVPWQHGVLLLIFVLLSFIFANLLKNRNA